MSLTESVQEYVARQPRLTWRRVLLRGLIRTLGFRVLWKMDIAGLENIPPTRPAILMINHLSLLDPVVAMGAVKQRFVIPMSKVENERNPLIAPFVWWWGAYYITRGEVDRKALFNSIELLKSGQLILIAPEGTRQAGGLVRPKDGLAYIATKADAAIIPTAITGAAGWERKATRLQRARIRVRFGRAFRFRGGDGRIPRETLAAMGEEAMYQLALALPDDPVVRGEYADISRATTQHLEFLAPQPEPVP
jgi:1-acyl-sn-glycerol-3-phosphate acyltransferase